MAFREHQHAGDAAAFAEMVEMPVQDGGAGVERRLPQHAVHMLQVAQAVRVPKVDDEVRTGVAHAVARNEVVLRLRRGAAASGRAHQGVRSPRSDQSVHSVPLLNGR